MTPIIQSHRGKRGTGRGNHQTIPVDLLITDLRMPVMGGPELYCGMENRPDIPVIVMSASENPRRCELGTTVRYCENR
jgi:CheY-like chemotaxis protein